MNTQNPWDNEYVNKGIPSSLRSEPSGVLLWLLNNLSDLGLNKTGLNVLDVGCGKGRNAIFLATLGNRVKALDSSRVAIDAASTNAEQLPNEVKPDFILNDLNEGLPDGNSYYDLITDIFVYKHQTNYELRVLYRKRLKQALKEKGILLLSLADKEDGYYSICPEVENDNQGLKTILDEEVGIQSVLFSITELIYELSPDFELEMAWIKTKNGRMHGQEYQRKTIATIWRPKK